MSMLRRHCIPHIAPMLAAVLLVLGLGGPAQCLAMLTAPDAGAICYASQPDQPTHQGTPDKDLPQRGDHACPMCQALGDAVSPPAPAQPAHPVLWVRVTPEAPPTPSIRPSLRLGSQQPRAPPLRA